MYFTKCLFPNLTESLSLCFFSAEVFSFGSVRSINKQGKVENLFFLLINWFQEKFWKKFSSSQKPRSQTLCLEIILNKTTNNSADTKVSCLRDWFLWKLSNNFQKNRMQDLGIIWFYLILKILQRRKTWLPN